MALKIPPCAICGTEALSMTLLADRYWVCSSHLQRHDEWREAVSPQDVCIGKIEFTGNIIYPKRDTE